MKTNEGGRPERKRHNEVVTGRKMLKEGGMSKRLRWSRRQEEEDEVRRIAIKEEAGWSRKQGAG